MINDSVSSILPCTEFTGVSYPFHLWEKKKKKTAVKMPRYLNSLCRSVFQQWNSVPCWGSSENPIHHLWPLSRSYAVLRHESLPSGLLQKCELQSFFWRRDEASKQNLSYKTSLNLSLQSIEHHFITIQLLSCLPDFHRESHLVLVSDREIL